MCFVHVERKKEEFGTDSDTEPKKRCFAEANDRYSIFILRQQKKLHRIILYFAVSYFGSLVFYHLLNEHFFFLKLLLLVFILLTHFIC